jgi:hypothetical protein
MGDKEYKVNAKERTLKTDNKYRKWKYTQLE